MPIAFARLEFVKRSAGKNACGKAAYNSRSRILFLGNELQQARVYDWSRKPSPLYHEVLLPEGVDSKFKSPELLWNLVEQKEVRRNSQTAFEMVLALPDDQVISLEDKKYLTRSFVEEHFVKQGLAVQIDIHAPEKQEVSDENSTQADHNWHAHVLATTRRFKGQELDEHKARELMPVMRGGKVIAGTHWGKLWAQHQNFFFEQKGLSLRVDTEGVVAQKHLGPVRMRGRALSLLYENDLRISLNTLESEDPKNILDKITQTKNIFSIEDIDRYLHKHVNPERVFAIKDAFWKQNEVIQLLDPTSNKPLNKFTTPKIIEEEKQIIRLGDRLFQQKAHQIDLHKADSFAADLTQEQKRAFSNILAGQRLICIEGHAGTGKSYLLSALKNIYEENGHYVRGFGPDSTTSQVLQEKGFTTAENVYRFLFALHGGKREIAKNEIWILDESGKLGTRPLLELLKCANRYGAQLILSGNSAQLSAVERGSAFKTFSERYGAQHLEDIQRQQEQVQRTIAKKLAIGEMGQALDAIVTLGNIHWNTTKEESIEKLVTTWALNKKMHPNESTLIIAHSNREVRVLNALARLYRKEVGELTGKEYQCETAFGKIDVSCGDWIEFRKNDKELGVINGMCGVLIKATSKSFTVQLKEGGQTCHVTFDPQLYQNFQLGYATTYYRSQGRTVDKAYVLHSPLMNKEMFYVGLTRHVKKVECFIATQETKYLSELKRQAYRETPKESTLEYLTNKELEKQHYLKSLQSDFISQAKKMGISLWQEIHTKIIEPYKDRQPDRSFFNPKIEKESKPSKVRELSFDESNVKQREHFLKERENLPTVSLDAIRDNDKDSTHLEQTLSIRPKVNNNWQKLSEEKKSILKEYFDSIDKASALYTIVRSEEISPHVQEWQKACGERNSCAHQIIHSLKSNEVRSIFNPKGLAILQERAAKHELLLDKENSKLDLDANLKEKLEPLLFKLFPEGPTKRDSKSLRFGNKGSLAVTFTGQKIGHFFDFEQRIGGGPLQLIQKSLACSQAEAITWAKHFLGENTPLSIPSQFTIKKTEKEQEWVSLKPTTPAPSLKELAYGLTLHYQEKARYTYRDENGQILFHTLRLEDENNKKIVLPLSFGSYQDGVTCWSLKGYQADKKPLYNLHLLKEYPHANVLIVEGEKTAEAASQMFPPEKMICLTWSGGAGAVDKSDWHPLLMREVTIWPDNDKAGFEASDAICKELRRIGIKSLHEVDRTLLAKELPSKWDLADPLPQGERFIKDALLRVNERGVGLNVLISHLKTSGLQIDSNTAHKVLVHTEEKMRTSLEQKFGSNHVATRSALLEETLQILKDRTRLKGVLDQSNVSRVMENKGVHLYELENRDISIDKSKDRGFEQ